MWDLLRKIKRFFFPDPIARFWTMREHIVRPTGWRRHFTPLYTHMAQKILDRYNALIPCLDRIRPFATPHGLAGIFISYGATIGEGCTIFHQVTIGSNTLPDSRGQGAPIIGDNVYIGAGAKIIGGVTVGDGARIGANCVVTFDVPPYATVVLSQPKVICHNEPRDNTFLSYAQYSKRETQPAP